MCCQCVVHSIGGRNQESWRLLVKECIKNPAEGRDWLSQHIRIIALCQKLNKTFGSYLEHLPVFKAPCGDNLQQNAGTINTSNPEYLPVLKASHGDHPEQKAGTIHSSNLEHLPVFKALCGSYPEQNAGTIYESNLDYLLVCRASCGYDLRVQSGTPPCF